MTKDLTFDIRYDNELAHEYYGDGHKLADKLRAIYSGQNLIIPNEFESTLTTPPIHFMSVTGPDDVDVDDLKKVEVPPGLNVEILDFTM
ncbi:uncharacterized protein ACLA_059520 [Aspergillus clavatus NRRL 1]|uniref:Uncharacterized protein n=1 Tax=Aspergillus clavatus (strain ATCC 1007 / CBS 513.65 / DSM 816 / NCTC 3887 / NRRL 1 / QM 1276 / 107) TaxID=344612 RepID=A1C4E5_ASPCL|nr:uncharacterized protein ACLA_059520 [Aspergillus clavatus NRRL 1]EAW15285.1 hypothetical protein ACLA_059520 [Aspergillus clavatus NRRL 1]